MKNIKEWHRTLILFVLLGLLIATVFLLNTELEQRALDTLGTSLRLLYY